ncbi:MAG: hypothetical protein Q9165_001795 [Trypethelium subeluteriae]
MEYAGEIITQEECENRMNNEYKDNKCYYLMEFEQGMIIDATRGSMARFVNHSCEPNCRMEQWKVNGEPRMALFAGDDGILVGEELTYDYNFDPFSSQNVQECHCGAPSCRGFLGPRTRDAPKAKKDLAGTSNNPSKSSSTITAKATKAPSASKRKTLASTLKRTAAAAAATANSSLDTKGFDLDSSSSSASPPPAKKAKTLKDAARSAYATARANLADALQAAESSRRLQRQKQQEKADKENGARAARIARRRSGGDGGNCDGNGDGKGVDGDVAASSHSTARSALLASSSSSSGAIEAQALLTKQDSGSNLAVAVSAAASRKSGSGGGNAVGKQRRHTLATTATTAATAKKMLGRTAQAASRRAEGVRKVGEKKQKGTVAKRASPRGAAQPKNSEFCAVEADDGFVGLADGLPSSSRSSSSNGSSSKDGKSESSSSSSSLPTGDVPASDATLSTKESSLPATDAAELMFGNSEVAWMINYVKTSVEKYDVGLREEQSTEEQEPGAEPATVVENNAFDRLIAGSRRARADEMQRAEMRKKKREGKKTAKAVESGA